VQPSRCSPTRGALGDMCADEQIPVCCPYFAMQSYKFKVKLTPAQGKKGKVAKQAQQMFLKVRCAWLPAY